MAGAQISEAAAPTRMPLRVTTLLSLGSGITAVIKLSLCKEVWRSSAIFAVQMATSHFRGNHLAAVWQVGEGASLPLNVSVILRSRCGFASYKSCPSVYGEGSI
jgi:hypothetical protein